MQPAASPRRDSSPFLSLSLSSMLRLFKKREKIKGLFYTLNKLWA